LRKIEPRPDRNPTILTSNPICYALQPWAPSVPYYASTDGCVRLIHTAIEDFNSCAANGINIVTGKSNLWCSDDEITSIHSKFFNISGRVKTLPPNATVSDWTNYITDDAGQNTLTTTIANLPCKPCYDKLFVDRDTYPNFNGAMQCSGFHENLDSTYYPWDVDQAELYLNVFRYLYRIILKCLPTNDVLGCSAPLAGIPVAVLQTSTYFYAMQNLLLPLQSDNLLAVQGKIFGFYSVGSKFITTTGGNIPNFNSTQCTTVQFASAAALVNPAQLIAIGMNATTTPIAAARAARAILPQQVALLPCGVCFEALAALVNINKDDLITCSDNPASDYCLDNLMRIGMPMYAFRECTGGYRFMTLGATTTTTSTTPATTTTTTTTTTTRSTTTTRRESTDRKRKS